MAVLAMASCSPQPLVREYDEVVVKPSAVESAFEGSAVAQDSPLAWETPQGWQELPGDGIRVAAFAVQRGSRAAETTIVLLGGAAGGVRANVERWLEQLGLSLTAAEVADFLDTAAPVAARSGLQLSLFDFTPLGAPLGESMVSALGSVAGQTVFVKMTGDPALVQGERAAFEELLRTLAVRSAAAR